ncbi:MAG: RHS repeat protein [Proteobacteria bacterium]|nr:RHS repeat protein [Pseudomonadota bacterium]MBS0464192.1 RHS repeat protein [Pseudomonadota bacterium]
MRFRHTLAPLLATIALTMAALHAPLAHADTGSTGYNLGEVESDLDASALRQGSGPIVYATGNLVFPETDISGKGEMALFLTRTYNSYWSGVGIFGGKWQSNFDYKLSFNTSRPTGVCYPKPGGVCATVPTGTTSLVLWAHLPDGRRIKYVYSASKNEWLETKPAPIAYIVRNADGSYTLHNDHQGTENYSATGYVTSIRDAQNVGWAFAYNASNYLQSVTHTNGRKVVLTWTGNQLTQVTDPGGTAHTYTYSANALGAGVNLLTKVSGIGGDGMTTYTYYQYGDSRFAGALTGVSRDDESFANFVFDGIGRATTRTLGYNSTQSVYTFVYTSGANNTLSVLETSPLGRQTTYTFVNGLVTSTSGTGGANAPDASKSHSYDANGYDSQVTDFNGNVTAYTYAANGQLQQKVEASGQPEARTTQYTWDTTPGTNRLLKVVVPGDHETDYSYDPLTQRVASVTQINLTANGVANQAHTVTYAYTNNTTNGMLLTMVANGPVAGNSDQVTSSYSIAGDVIAVRNNLGQTTTWSGYNALGEPGQMVGPNGDKTVYTYNTLGQVTNVQTAPNGVAANTTYMYTPSGQLASVTTPDAVTENYEYDDTRRLIAKYRATGGTVAGGANLEEEDYLYNTAGEVVEIDETAKNGVWKESCIKPFKDKEGEPDCAAWAFGFVGTSTTVSSAFRTYDGLGRVWKSTGNNNQNFVNGYDKNGNVIATTDSLGHVTTYVYDHLNRKIGSVDANDGFTAISYDAGDRVKSIVDPRFLVTTYVYDGFGQMWAQSSPDTGTVSFTWDAGGRKTSFKRADGMVTTYGYDGLNRVATATAGGQTQTFAYDTCTHGVGRLCSVSDAFSGYTDTLTTSYTPEGWVASQSSTVAGNNYNTAYAYDSLGRVTGVTYPNGVAANYAYTAGKLAAVTATINGITSNVATGLSYQPYAGVAGWTYGNGLVRGNNYDLDGRLTGISTTIPSSTVLQSLTFRYDADNSITAITNGVNAGLTQSFSYDPLIRLTGATSGSGNTAWGYDADSNRSSQSVGTASTGYTLAPASNELNGLTGTGPRTFGYDANGNRISDSGTNGAIAFHYDPFNRMDSSAKGGATTSYHVDPQGRRVYKATGGNWTHFVYATDGSLLSENGNAGMTDYIWMGGALVGMVRGGALDMVHTDQLGRPEIVTNAAKAVVWRANNFAFDRTVTQDSIGGLNIGFPGQYYDAETGLWNNGFRDYDASVGRYVESDPMGLAGGLNTFEYVDNAPVMAGDPFGETPSLTVNHSVPPGSVLYQAPSGQFFYAPANANFGGIETIGAAYGFLGSNAYVGHFGIYDFQRQGASATDGGTFWSEWTNASNFAVGVYMYGAGYSMWEMDTLVGTIAFGISSNAGNSSQVTWWNNGWIAASLGKLGPVENGQAMCMAPWASLTLPAVHIPFAGDNILNDGSAFTETTSLQAVESVYPAPPDDTQIHKK